MHTAIVSPDIAGWVMLAASLVSVGFLLWFLIGVVIETKRTRSYYIVSYDQGTRNPGEIHEDQAHDRKTTPRQYTVRMDLSSTAGPGLR
jgi:hypothetical protein